MKIFYVEDCKRAAFLFTKLMNSLGHNVCHRENGFIGLGCYKNYFKRISKTGKKFDIIVCDFQMPKMNGLEFVKKVREFDKDIPIVANSSDKELSEKMVKCGANIVVPKNSNKEVWIEAFGKLRVEQLKAF